MFFDDLFISVYGIDSRLLTALPTAYEAKTGKYTYEWEIPGYSRDEISTRISDSKFLFEAKNEIRGTKTNNLKFHVRMDSSTAKVSLKDGILTLTICGKNKSEDMRALEVD